jgi:hypothetical protein
MEGTVPKEPISTALALLAPVPAVHLDWAAAELAKTDRASRFVTFGSDAFPFWATGPAVRGEFRLPEGRYEVLIYRSRVEAPRAGETFEKPEVGATFVAIVEGWSLAADVRDPEVVAGRPKPTQTDTEWVYWWWVSGLHRLDAVVRFDALNPPGKRKFPAGFYPHGPMAIDPPGR